MVRLIFKNSNFSEGREEAGDAVLILEETTSVGKLEYSPGAGLIIRRTARRQAESICKSGFLLVNGKRIGMGFKLESDEDRIEDRLLQKGYHYR
ncbi:MAG: hypothetical protein KAT16_03300 [Candidatus Heimdallarchaeota archaeon]|nr:hypothetical protein [Candidatus Heimdallarchaeota archaeon]